MSSRRPRVRTILSAAAVALAVGTASLPAHATNTALPIARVKQPKVTPKDAAKARAEVEAKGIALVKSGESIAAGIEYDNAASQLGDPVLYLDAGEAYLQGAEKSRNRDLAEAAIERGMISLDILYFHLDSTADKNFRLVEATEVPALIVRAQELIEDAEITIEEIEEEEAAAAAKPVKEGEPPKKKRRTGRAAKITGWVFVGAGAAFLGVGAAGVGLGVQHQNTAEHPTVYGDEYDDVAAKGKRANMMAIIGLPTAAGLIGIGVTILVLTSKKYKKKKRKKADDYALVPTTDGRGGGMAVVGRF